MKDKVTIQVHNNDVDATGPTRIWRAGCPVIWKVTLTRSQLEAALEELNEPHVKPGDLVKWEDAVGRPYIGLVRTEHDCNKYRVLVVGYRSMEAFVEESKLRKIDHAHI